MENDDKETRGQKRKKNAVVSSDDEARKGLLCWGSDHMFTKESEELVRKHLKEDVNKKCDVFRTTQEQQDDVPGLQ